jgi:hypothetical protein
LAEWNPFQIHYFSENLGAPGIEPGISGSVARNSDHYTTEAVSSIYTPPALTFRISAETVIISVRRAELLSCAQ